MQQVAEAIGLSASVPTGGSLKIGLDAHALADVGTGNRTYVRGLLRALTHADHGHVFMVYYTKPGSLPSELHHSRGFCPRRISPHTAFVRIPIVLPLVERLDHLDILHTQWVLPSSLSCKTVVSIHDLCYEHYPTFFPWVDRLLLRRLVPASARRADMILTPSEFSRRDIVNRYGINPDKMVVVRAGVEPHFRPVRDHAALSATRRRFDLTDPFILFVGRTDPRKGVDTLVQAFRLLKEQGLVGHTLAIAGPQGSAERKVRDAVRLHGLDSATRFLGVVPDADLPSLMSAAHIVAYPSIFEGFGLPVLEAMACGTPLVTTNATALPEVVGCAGLMVAPSDVVALAGAIARLIGDPELRAALAKRGLAKARQFSWEASARQVLGLYQTIAGTSHA